jgi:Domain of unknown function (DUF4129)
VTVRRPVSKVIAVLAAAWISWSATADCRARAQAGAPAPADAGADPAGAAREVLQGPDFWWKRIEARTIPTSWLGALVEALRGFFGRMLENIGDLIGWILKRLFGMFRGGSGGDGTLVIWAIVMALLAWSIWKLYPVVKRWLGTSRSLPGTREAVAWEPLAEASDLFEQAGRSFREGQYAEAIRLALLALIARLEKQGRLRYDTTRTNREYQRELRQTPELAACFGQLARIYERVWYGRMSAGRDEAEQAIRLCGSALDGEGLAPE